MRTYRRVAQCLFALAVLAALHCSKENLRPTGVQDPLSGGDRDREPFDHDWRFQKGEVAGGEQPGLDDSPWRSLDLPHDWAIEGAFDKRYDPHTGGLDVAGTAWYRKHFHVPASERGRHYAIEFDGAMSNARVYLNGRELGTRPYGYIGFAFDLTRDLLFGETENVLAVRLAPEPNASRWYPGAGIYRHVWLESTTDVHIARWGTAVTTPDVSDERARVVVRTELRNRRPDVARVTLQTTVLDAQGRSVAQAETHRTIAGQSSEAADVHVDIPRPHRWDIEDPYLYSVQTIVRDGPRVVDRTTTGFGVRTIQFDKSRGFFLNGRHLKLHGICMHHDLGALGAAVNAHAIDRQLRLMKEMGANALRTSHNPPAPEVLDACDRLGLLVMDEAFDMWRTPKSKNDYSKHFEEWGETDLRDMIRRDRNHPSVILYSIGNEVPEQSQPDGWKIAARLTRACHEEDPSRPVTAAFNQPDAAIRNGLAGEVDIQGFNYQARGYARILREHPDWTVVGSETSSAVSSRGVYHLPIRKYDKDPSLQLTGYDIIATSWAYPPDVEFDAQERNPSVLGEFVWTGFDYLGEPTPYFLDGWGPEYAADWPARSSYFGIVDLAGFPKDRYFLYQSEWADRPMVHVLPHWTWPGREGQLIPVIVYTNVEEAELFVNGRSHGRKRRGSSPMVLPVGANVSLDGTFSTKYRLLWRVPYEAGALRAVAFSGGKEVAATEVRTAGPPARLRVSADHTRLRADGEDLAFLTVRVEDKDGNLCPVADNLVHFEIEGPAKVAGVDNGSAATVEPFQASERHAFGGLCLLIVRPTRDQPGGIRVVSRADGLQTAETVLISE